MNGQNSWADRNIYSACSVSLGNLAIQTVLDATMSDVRRTLASDFGKPIAGESLNAFQTAVSTLQ